MDTKAEAFRKAQYYKLREFTLFFYRKVVNRKDHAKLLVLNLV
jgi:hypothetical protein